MPNVIEEAKSGRATCRTCRQLIEKGAPRFGLETPGFDGNTPGHMWHHVLCAVKKHAKEVQELLPGYAGNFPNKAEVEAALAAGPAPTKAAAAERTYPYAERASTGRAKCIACEQAIEKGALRIAIEREIEVMGNLRKGPGYFHAACAGEAVDDLEKLKPNSPELSAADFDALAAARAG